MDESLESTAHVLNMRLEARESMVVELSSTQKLFIAALKESKDLDINMAMMGKNLVEKNNKLEGEVIFLTKRLTDALRKSQTAEEKELHMSTAHLKYQNHLRNALKRSCKSTILATFERWKSWLEATRLISKARMELADEYEVREIAQYLLRKIRLGCAEEMAVARTALVEMEEEVKLQGENTVFDKTVQTLNAKLGKMEFILDQLSPTKCDMETQTGEAETLTLTLIAFITKHSSILMSNGPIADTEAL